MALPTRVGIVTAVTVVSMLLGGGAMNALAKDNGHGKGHANKTAQVEARAAANDVLAAPDSVTGETRPGLGCGDRNHEHTGPPGNPDKECTDKHNDDD